MATGDTIGAVIVVKQAISSLKEAEMKILSEISFDSIIWYAGSTVVLAAVFAGCLYFIKDYLQNGGISAIHASILGVIFFFLASGWEEIERSKKGKVLNKA